MALSTFTLRSNCHHHPSPELLPSCKTETLHPSNKNSPSLPPPAAGSHSTFCFYNFNYPKDMAAFLYICFYLPYAAFPLPFIGCSQYTAAVVTATVCGVQASFPGSAANGPDPPASLPAMWHLAHFTGEERVAPTSYTNCTD